LVTSLSCANRESELSGRSIRLILDASIIRAIVSKFSIWLALLAARSRMRLAIGCMGEKLMTKKTAALYARFSSELQKDRSVDDQFALCEQVAKREGFKIVARYCDRAKSGSKEFGREGFQQLKDAARRREFDVIIVEEHDRLSRDQEGMAGFWKRLKHYGIELWTPKGKQNDLDVGIRSFVSQVFLDDLANKIKRAQGPLVREGLFPGSVTYGYDRLLHQPGVRVINEREAEVVRRIFREYADRISPREIAAGLTRDGIPTPSGGKNWNHQTFVGGSYARGFIGNRIYIGEIVWNTHRQSKDPETEKTLKRPTPASDHIIAKAPELRIIDQTLWDRAQAVRNSRSLSKFGPEGKVTRTPVVARNDHLLAGLLRCGACNGHMRIANTSRNGSGRVACAAAHQHGTCKHSKTYDLGILKALILDKLRGSLVDPEAIREATRAFHERFAERAKRDNVERIAAQKQLNKVKVQLDRIVATILDVGASPIMSAQLKEKEAERAQLEERIRLLSADNVMSLHPTVLKTYTETIEKLHQELTTDRETAETRRAFRNVIDSIVVHPTGKRMPYEVDAYGRLSAIMGIDLFPVGRSGEEIIAAEGLPAYSDNGHTGKSVSS